MEQSRLDPCVKEVQTSQYGETLTDKASQEVSRSPNEIRYKPKWAKAKLSSTV